MDSIWLGKDKGGMNTQLYNGMAALCAAESVT